MTRPQPSRLAALSAALAAAAVAAVMLAASSGAQTGQARTLTLFEPEQGASFTIVDDPPRSAARGPERFRTSIGDRGIFSGRVLDKKGGTTLGRVVHEVTVVKGNHFRNASFLTHVAMSLKDGQLDAQGFYGVGTTRTLAVVGGTGAYAGARGTYTNTDAGNDIITLQP